MVACISVLDVLASATWTLVALGDALAGVAVVVGEPRASLPVVPNHCGLQWVDAPNVKPPTSIVNPKSTRIDQEPQRIALESQALRNEA